MIWIIRFIFLMAILLFTYSALVISSKCSRYEELIEDSKIEL